MSFWIILMIMLFTGIIGGTVNYLMPANNPQPGKFLSPWTSCVLLGLGATLLVPLFLEIAQSRLLDDINFSVKWDIGAGDTSNRASRSAVSDTIVITRFKDSTGSIVVLDTGVLKSNRISGTPKPVSPVAEARNTGKDYLIWAAYCLLSAAAGLKFINMVINNVVKQDQLKEQQAKIGELEKDIDMRTQISQRSQQKQDLKVRETLFKQNALQNFQDNNPGTDKLNKDIPFIPSLPPVTHANDPQKGRFGGQSKANGRKLSAKVDKSSIPSFYNVVLTVESTDNEKPLTTDVIFYLHDSFNPSVYTVKPNAEGKAIDDEILSYGAFTVGVITDNGKTLLELDMADDKDFPKDFRDR